MTIASLLYHLAMRDEMLPRFPAAEMPPLPAGRGGGARGELTFRLAVRRSLPAVA